MRTKRNTPSQGNTAKNCTVQAGCIRGTSLFVIVVAVVPQCLITFSNVSVPCKLQTLALGLRSAQSSLAKKHSFDDLQHQHCTFPSQQSSFSKAPRITKESRTTVRCLEYILRCPISARSWAFHRALTGTVYTKGVYIWILHTARASGPVTVHLMRTAGAYHL